MDFFEVIKLRRSIRAYTDAEVSEKTVEKLIDAARLAPSAGDIQPWEFIVIRRPEIKRGLAAAALNQTFIEEAPVVIVVCADENRSRRGYGGRGASLYCIQDTAAATENLLLAACALGLGACWIGAFYEEEVGTIMNLPKGVRPIAIVPIGYPAERPASRYKRPLEEIIHHETF